MKTKFREMYLDWRNNFLTVDCFAEHYGITKTEATFIIKSGRKYHNLNVNQLIKNINKAI